jgi:hypothetical protein
MYFLGGSGGSLVYQTEEVPELSTFATLGYYAESDLVANHDYGFGSGTRTIQESLELLQNLTLASAEHPRRDPQGEGVEENNRPSVCGFKDVI